MLLQVITVRDRAANAYGAPAYNLTTGGAIRSFGDEVNRADSNNMLYLHPEDFELFLLGTFEDSGGSFVLLERPRQLAIGKDLIRMPKEGR